MKLDLTVVGPLLTVCGLTLILVQAFIKSSSQVRRALIPIAVTSVLIGGLLMYTILMGIRLSNGNECVILEDQPYKAVVGNTGG